MRWVLYFILERRGLRKQIATLQAALDAERDRNRTREDELLSRVLTASGTYGVAPRQAPVKQQPEKIQIAPLSDLDEGVLEAYRAAAVAAGRPASDGDRVFEAEREGRTIDVYQPPSSDFLQ